MTTTTGARVARTMNDHPITVPTASPATLSEDARNLYWRWLATGAGQVDRDLLDRRSRHAFVSERDAKKFAPSDRMLAAIAEIQAAGLGTWEPKQRYLEVARVHDAYTIAFGRGSQLIEVHTFTEHPYYDSRLLAVIIGGDVTTTQGRRGVPDIVVRARHLDATDFEHDASSSALVDIKNPSPAIFDGYGLVEFTGVMTRPLLYGLGVDPLTAVDGGTQPGLCTTCSEPHPFAPYQPPVLEGFEAPTFVKITARPINHYTVADPAVPGTTESEITA